MIVKQRKLELPKNLLFNIGGVSIIALAGILAMRSSLVEEEIPLCEARYSGGVLFSNSKSRDH